MYPDGSGPAVPDHAMYTGLAPSRATKPPVQSVATGPTGTAFTTVNGLYQTYQPLGYYLPWEILDFIELLARFNPDYSQAVSNIKTLANSGHEVFVSAGTALQQRKVQSLIAEKSRTIQERNGGIDGLIDKLLNQAATFGAMCFSGDTEIITSEGVREIGSLAGSTVQVMSRGGRWVKAPISSFGEQPLMEVSLRAGRATKVVRATPDHRWLVQASSGDPGARQQRRKGQSRKLASYEVDRTTSELVVGHKMLSVEGDQQRGIVHDLLALSPWGVAAGVTYGDGCAQVTSRGSHMAANLDLYDDNINDLLKFFPLSPTAVTKKDWNGRGLRVTGLPRSFKKLPPADEASDYLLGWLAGYFAADGAVSADGRAVISSMDERSMRTYRDLLVRFGVRCSLRSSAGTGGGVVEKRDYGTKWLVSWHASELPERFYVRPHHAARWRARVHSPRPWVVESVRATGEVEEVFCATVPVLSCFALEGNLLTGNCGEWLLSEDLTEVVDFADVNPKTIRFFWHDRDKRWHPYQKVTAVQLQEAKDRGQEIVNGCIKLNEVTFHYYAFDSPPNSPYGTPPFLAALEPLAIQKDMTINMSQIVKKLGLLGIIDVAVKQLPIKPGESPEAYQARAANYLDQLVVAVEDMVRDGGMVHYDDLEAQTYNITGNAAGATNIFKQNEEQVFSGLNSMPSVQGRSYCVVPSTRVLTADLKWVAAGDLDLGDELVAFDEHLGKGQGRGNVARLRRSTVEANGRVYLDCVRVKTTAGEITVSKQHPLVRMCRTRGRVWTEAANLRFGDSLSWFGDPWEQDGSFEGGYLAGIIDGEGTMGRGKQQVRSLMGGRYETMRLLGSLRPYRFMPRSHECWEGAMLRNSGTSAVKHEDCVTVLAIEDVGEQEVVALQTSTRTFVAEGLLNHNSTTETYAGVAYDIIIRNTVKYQRACKRMIEAGFYLMATTAGLNPDQIQMNFKSNKTLHRLQDAQSEAIELKNGLVKWAAGVITQAQFAQELGYSTVAVEYAEIPENGILNNAGNVNTGNTQEGDGTGGGKPDNKNDSKPSSKSVAEEELEQLLDSPEGQA
jgi:hypothetical protein